MKTFYIAFTLALVLLFISCTETKKETEKKPIDLSAYTEKGKTIAMNTQKLLGKNLKGTMKAEGPVAAVAFCNAKANPLTAEMEQKFGATIKRVSDKNRNPNNAPNEVEAKIIADYISSLQAGKEIKPITQEEKDGKIHFYAPIKVKGLCLACHGDAIATPVDSILKVKYPNDKAVGYKAGELRGIWSITMDKK